MKKTDTSGDMDEFLQGEEGVVVKIEFDEEKQEYKYLVDFEGIKIWLYENQIRSQDEASDRE